MNIITANSLTCKLTNIVAALLSAAVFMGCAEAVDDVDDEVVGEASEEIGESTCASISPVATYTGFVPVGTPYESPQTYSTSGCYKALAVQINSYSGSYVGAPGTDYGGTFVEMIGGATTQTACEALWVRADLYEWSSALGAFTFIRSKEAHGSWMSFFGNWSCYPPGVGFRNAWEDTALLVSGHTYKIVTTARTSTTGSTVPFRIDSEQDGYIK